MNRLDLGAARHRVVTPVVTRFAPSPTGYLHLGHVVNAIYVWGTAEALGGEVRLRIEDHDRIRSRPAFTAALLEDLEWLGFLNTGPSIVRQQDRSQVYSHALDRLRRVAHVYACDCSRTSFRGDVYSGRCRARGLTDIPGRSLRVQLEPAGEHAHDLLIGEICQAPDRQCGDLVVRDRHGQWTYQFAVTVDDLDQGVTLVIRGQDLLSSTGRQVQLGRMLRRAGVGHAQWPPVYLHHPLIMDATGMKLSKSTGATGVRHLRATGVTPAEVIGRAAAAVGLLNVPCAVEARRVGQLIASLPPAPSDSAQNP